MLICGAVAVLVCGVCGAGGGPRAAAVVVALVLTDRHNLTGSP